MAGVTLQFLFAIHITAGFTALAAGVGATVAMFFNLSHRWHVRCETLFVLAMAAAVITAFPIAVFGSNYALLLIALFSGYLVYAGWRYAKNRLGTPTAGDWTRVAVMAVSALAMLSFGSWLLLGGDLQGITLLVFAVVGGGLCLFDAITLRSGGAKGKWRIAFHLTMMLSAFTATVTAFVVVNVSFQPAFVLWLIPTAAITPIIVWWNARTLAGYKPTGMPKENS